MNDIELMMVETFLDWMKEYPIQYIDYAYHETIGKWMETDIPAGEFVKKAREAYEIAGEKYE